MMLSYTEFGGIFDKLDIDVPKYQHSINGIKNEIEKVGFKLILLKKGTNISTNVPYQIPNKTYDIIAKRD